MGALFSGIEEAAVDEGEAENLARAILSITKQRKVKLNPEALAWGNFASVLLTVYLPRVIAVLAKRREAADQRSAAQRRSEAQAEPIVLVDMDAAGNLKPQMAN